MKTTMLALIAPVFAISMLCSAVAHGETEAEHVAALMSAPMQCYARPSDSTKNGTILVCTPVMPAPKSSK
jgi:hypothetical protein